MSAMRLPVGGRGVFSFFVVNVDILSPGSIPALFLAAEQSATFVGSKTPFESKHIIPCFYILFIVERLQFVP